MYLSYDASYSSVGQSVGWLVLESVNVPLRSGSYMLLLEHLFHLILNVARIEKHFRNKTQLTTVLSFMVDLSSIA